MKWNYRVVKLDAGDEEDYGPWYEICEVFYEGDKPMGHTASGVAINGASIEELREVLELMLKCLDKPILDDMGGDE